MDTGGFPKKGKEDLKMNRLEKTLVVLSSVFCLVLLGSSAFSQGIGSTSQGDKNTLEQAYPQVTVGNNDNATGEFPVASSVGYEPMGRLNTVEASWLIGHRVMTPTNGMLGEISGLVIDRTNGRIAAVVLSDVPNIGGEALAIPFSSITNIGADRCDFNSGDMEIGPAPGADYQIDSSNDPTIYAVTHYPSYSKFYGLPSTIDSVWLSDIYRHYGQPPYWTEPGEKSPMSMDLYRSDRLMGAELQLPDGNAAGRIDDFVVDSYDGRVAFLVLSDVSGRPTTSVAVPFGILSVRSDNVFVLNTSGEKLAMAPGFDESNNLNDSRWAGDVYRYFGQEPYWTE